MGHRLRKNGRSKPRFALFRGETRSQEIFDPVEVEHRRAMLPVGFTYG
jgi:hypothetical protein